MIEDTMKPSSELWENALALIENKLDGIVFDTWIGNWLSLIHCDHEDRILYIGVPSDFRKGQLEYKYKKTIEEAVKEAFGALYKIRFLLPGEEPSSVKETETQGEDKEIIFNPRHTFDNFVVGDNSRFAEGAAQAVAKAPGKKYSPLFIYGESGLGKTHLMNAIGIYILEHFPKLNVLYVSSETFTDDFVNASIHKKMSDFKGKYRGVDVLLIDDIQFISEKEKTIEEVFHTYQALYNSRKQMVFTSDRPPKDILGLDKRLQGRLAEGLTVDLKPPSYEIKIAILKKKAELIGLPVDDGLSEVISFIAENIKSNVRELEGAFNTVVAYASLLEEPFTKNLAKRTLGDIINIGGKASIKDIKKVVANHYNIAQSALDSEERSRSLSVPRQIAMYLCYELTETSFPKIAEAFKKDYSTVHYGYEKIKKEIETNENLRNIVAELKEKIQSDY